MKKRDIEKITITTPDGKLVETTPEKMYSFAESLKQLPHLEAEAPYLEELEKIVRERQTILAEKSEAMKDFKDRLDATDAAQARILKNLDGARAPKPPLLEKMAEPEEDMPWRDCPACSDSYPVSKWDANGGKCPGCGK